jgi:phage tail-like protein
MIMFKFRLFLSGLFLLFASTMEGKAQYSRVAVEWNSYKIVFTTVSGIDTFKSLSGSTVVLRSSPLQRVNTVSVKSISLKGGNCSMDNELYKWFCTFSQTTRQKRDVTVKLLNSNGELVRAWKIRQASPVKVEAPSLNAKGTDVAIETVVLAYEGIEPE